MFPKLEDKLPREIERCTYFIQNVFKYKNFDRAIIGISGGIDSAVIASLCVKALGKENVIGIMLPRGKQIDIADSELLCKTLDIKSEKFCIHNSVESLRLLEENVLFDKVRTGNIIARVRMIVLYDQSVKYSALVVGTSNKTELMMGYFTLHGDGACALEPIGHLYKSQVKEMAIALDIPKSIIEKAPSAGLWDGQTDEGELGLNYDILDCILLRYDKIKNDTNNDWSKQKIVENISDNLQLDFFLVSRIIDIVERNKFKLAPPVMLGTSPC